MQIPNIKPNIKFRLSKEAINTIQKSTGFTVSELQRRPLDNPLTQQGGTIKKCVIKLYRFFNKKPYIS